MLAINLSLSCKCRCHTILKKEEYVFDDSDQNAAMLNALTELTNKVKEHEAICQYNPDNKYCVTCAFYHEDIPKDSWQWQSVITCNNRNRPKNTRINKNPNRICWTEKGN